MQSKKILFVVHRAPPFPGGSENYVKNMAEEMLRRGHKPAIYANEHKGSYNGIPVTNDHNSLVADWDLIVVHGGDCVSQDMAHINAAMIKSPVLYMIIKPSSSFVCAQGLKYHRFLGYSTSEDQKFLKAYGPVGTFKQTRNRMRRVRHGVNLKETLGQPIFSNFMLDKKGIRAGDLFLSVGGWWPHKQMNNLAEAFWEANRPNSILALCGYDANSGPVPSERHHEEWNRHVVTFTDLPKEMIMAAMCEAKAYIMNSTEEGFGLVLLEAMLNHTPWIARNIAGAKDLHNINADFGLVYDTEKQLTQMLGYDILLENRDVQKAYEYAMANHTIEATCNDLEDILIELTPWSQINV